MNWELLLKYVNHKADAAETEQVNQWLQQQANHRQLLQYLVRRKEQLHTPLKQDAIHDEWVKLLDKIFLQSQGNDPQIKPMGRRFPYLGLAASIVLLSLLCLLGIKHNESQTKPETFTLKTPAYQQGQVTLPDGTQVFLAPDSRLVYSSDFGNTKRELRLNGEAFFKVKHNARKPFIVYTGSKISVTVLGTSFNVYARKPSVAEVKVATGLVGVKYNNHIQLLKPGQQFNYTAGTPVAAVQAVAVKEAGSLQSQILYFNNSSAASIAAQLQRWYNIRVSLAASAYKASCYSGEIKDDGIQSTLNAISYATGLHYRYQNSHTLILF